MDFGMPTLLELPDLEANAALCREQGLAFVELSMDMPEYQPDKIPAQFLRNIARDYGVYFTFHLSGFLNPCDFNDKIAAAYTQTALESIDIAKAARVPFINMHLPKSDQFTLPDKKIVLFDKYEQAFLRKLICFRDACTAAIGGADVSIGIENTRVFQETYGQTALAVLLENPVFAVTFDTGHDAGNGFQQRPVIDRHSARLGHMHLHDAKDKADHLALGDGTLALAGYLDLAERHDCRVVLEVKTGQGLRQSVDWLRERRYLP